MAAVKVSALILWRGLGFFVAGGPRGARGRDAVLQVESLPCCRPRRVFSVRPA